VRSSVVTIASSVSLSRSHDEHDVHGAITLYNVSIVIFVFFASS
jgi:hypothetical protein